MGKKETKLSDLVGPLELKNGEKIESEDWYIQFLDPQYYLKIEHPFRKGSILYVRSNEAFILTNQIIYLNRLIKQEKQVTEEIKEKINELILLVKLLDSYNKLEDKMYKCVIKSKKLYILY